MRRKHYPPPLPAKRQVQAHLAFFEQVKRGVPMELSKVEKKYLRRVISAEMQRMIKEMDHAACYGQEMMLPDFKLAENILDKLDE